jgi:hypothetical protein
MLNAGWFRLWIVVTATLATALTAFATYKVLGEDFCYSYVTISPGPDVSAESRKLIEHIREESLSRSYCGKTYFSPLITLEKLAEQGAVTQVAFQWLEPKG